MLLKYDRIRLHSARNSSRPSQIYGKINSVRGDSWRERKTDNTESFIRSLGYPRITLLALVRLSSVESLHCDEKRKDLSYRRGKFRSFGCSLPRGIFPFTPVSKGPSYPFASFCPRRCFRSLHLLTSTSCARQTFVCGSNGRTSLELTRIRKFCAAYER